MAADGITPPGGPQFGHLWFDPPDGGSKPLQNVSKYYQCLRRKNTEDWNLHQHRWKNLKSRNPILLTCTYFMVYLMTLTSAQFI